MKNLKGLYTDCYERDQPAGTYRHAKNMLISSTLGAIENEPGMIAHASVVPGTNIIGIVTMGADFAVFSTNPGSSTDYIGYCKFIGDTLQYTAVYTGNLGFKIEHPLKGEYQINLKGERIVAWIELGGDNPPRIINLDNPAVTTVNDLNLFPSYQAPSIVSTLSDTGGTFLTSTIIPMVKYKRADGTTTPWVIAPVPIKISDEPSTASSYVQDGAAPGTPTTKSIILIINRVDISYDTLIIGYIQVKNGVTGAFQVREVPASLSTTYTLTGSEATIDVTLDDILTPSAAYKNAQAITQLNNQLILANLTSEDVIDGQPIANKVIVNYTPSARRFSMTSFKNGTSPGTFQTGEVYALYLVLDLLTGGSLAFHIPGRGPISDDLVDDNSIATISAKKFQIQNTSDRPGSISNMSYWENSSETYPASFPPGHDATGNTQALAGQKVRHHKFPDQDSILDRHYNSGTSLDAGWIVYAALDVSNVIIPDNIKSRISRWRIAYAKRSYSNSLVIAADTLHLAADTSAGPGRIWTTGGNWNIKAVSGDGDNGWGDLQIWKNPATGSSNIRKANRGHAPDLLFDKPGVVPNYVHFTRKLSKDSLNTIYANPGDVGGQLMRSGDGAGQAPGVVIDWTLGSQHTLPGTRKAAVSNFQYIEQSQQVGNIETKLSEEIVYCEINNLQGILQEHGTAGLLDVTPPGLGPWGSYPVPNLPVFYTKSSGASPESGNFAFLGSNTDHLDRESTYYFYYKQILSDIYSGFDIQQLVSTAKTAIPSQTSLGAIIGGDVALCMISYMTTAVQSPTVENDAGQNIQGLRAFKHYLAEARHNWNYRYEATPAIEDKYAPKTNPRDFWTPRANNGGGVSLIDTTGQKLNKLSYNTDYDTVNEFQSVVIVKNIDDFSDRSPTTIIYSQTQSTESKDTAWTTFPVGNRYVQPRNRGEITNLQGYQNKELLIHHRDSLFMTQANLSLSGDTDDIKLKSGELFSIAPREILTTEEGFAGTQHSLACKMTKLGYTFPDDSQGKLFAFDGQLKELSKLGLRNFFRDEAHLGQDLVSFVTEGEVLENPEIDGPGDSWSQTTPADQPGWTTWSFNNSASVFTSTVVNWHSRIVFAPADIGGGTSVKIATLASIQTGDPTFTPSMFGVFLDVNRVVLSTFSFGSFSQFAAVKQRTQTVTAPAGTKYVGFYLTAGTTGSSVAGFSVSYFRVSAQSTQYALNDQNNPYNASGYTLAYDERFDRLLVTKKDSINNRSFTASFSPVNQAWSSFHDYIPDYMFSLSNMRLISLKGAQVYENNKGAAGTFFGEIKPSFVDVVSNEETDADKVVYQINWASAVYSGQTLVPNKSITHLTVRSEDKATGRIAIIRQEQIIDMYQTGVAREINQSWFYNNIYDIVTGTGFLKDFYEDFALDPTKLDASMPWYQRRKFIDKYIICRFEYDNADNYKFRLLDTDVDFNPTTR